MHNLCRKESLQINFAGAKLFWYIYLFHGLKFTKTRFRDYDQGASAVQSQYDGFGKHPLWYVHIFLLHTLSSMIVENLYAWLVT